MEGLFVHVHKAAGSSVKEMLFRELKVKNVRNLVGLHKGRRIWRAVRREDLTAEEFERAFKFCFVRNPWDRVVSAYEHNRRKWKGLFDDVTFESFIFDILLNESIVWDAHWLVRNRQVNQRTVALWEGKGHLAPYHHPGYFMADMDFIGRFENFTKDFHYALRKLRIKLGGKKIPRRNVSKRRPYQEYYTPRTRDAVGELYLSDITRFGYIYEDDTGTTAHQRGVA
jgi:hypothetical protein